MEKIKKLSALIQFSQTGELRRIFINAENDGEEKLIKKALSKLIRTNFLSWITRLFIKE